MPPGLPSLELQPSFGQDFSSLHDSTRTFSAVMKDQSSSKHMSPAVIATNRPQPKTGDSDPHSVLELFPRGYPTHKCDLSALKIHPPRLVKLGPPPKSVQPAILHVHAPPELPPKPVTTRAQTSPNTPTLPAKADSTPPELPPKPAKPEIFAPPKVPPKVPPKPAECDLPSVATVTTDNSPPDVPDRTPKPDCPPKPGKPDVPGNPGPDKPTNSERDFVTPGHHTPRQDEPDGLDHPTKPDGPGVYPPQPKKPIPAIKPRIPRAPKSNPGNIFIAPEIFPKT